MQKQEKKRRLHVEKANLMLPPKPFSYTYKKFSTDVSAWKKGLILLLAITAMDKIMSAFKLVKGLVCRYFNSQLVHYKSLTF